MLRRQRILGILVALACVVGSAKARSIDLLDPVAESTQKRAITIQDVLRLRRVDSISLSRDRQRFAVFIRRADPEENRYDTGWYVGTLESGALTYVGDGGEIHPDEGGAIYGRTSRWSPDGIWIAYTLQRNGETQLWRSRADGKRQEQLTRNPADVLDFEWLDENTIAFSVGTPRQELLARDQHLRRTGYRYDDLYVFTQFMAPPWPVRAKGDTQVWIVNVGARTERIASSTEKRAFLKAVEATTSGAATMEGSLQDEEVSPVVNQHGERAWLERVRPKSLFMRVVASRAAKTERPYARCNAVECTGFIQRVWWDAEGKRVLFVRRAGVDFSSFEFVSWSPSSGVVRTLLRAPDDDFAHCELGANDRLLCVRETKDQPAHLAIFDFKRGRLALLSDVNPEFRNIEIGVAERFEWDTPHFAWNEPGGALENLYPPRAYGYILYPPHFDPKKKYPIIIDPYYAKGFESSVGVEHAQHVYAANGFVVIKTTFPSSIDPNARLGSNLMRMQYSQALGFPHLSMLAGSTLAALDCVIARGFVDEKRVGIGGVSHGSFVPLFILQKYDRIAAASLSSPGWGPLTGYYDQTERTRISAAEAQNGLNEWAPPPPDREGIKYWEELDASYHVEAIEAPILMNMAAYESYGLVPLIRRLADVRAPYDAYVYRDETHTKWQPAHLQSIMERNLDWFRFWLQDVEDPVPTKAEQYNRWRKLRALKVSGRSSP